MDLCSGKIKYCIVNTKPINSTIKTQFGGWRDYLTLAFRIMLMIENKIFTKAKHFVPAN